MFVDFLIGKVFVVGALEAFATLLWIRDYSGLVPPVDIAAAAAALVNL